MIFNIVVSFVILGHLTYGNDINEEIISGDNAVRGQFPFMARTLLANSMTNVTHGYIFCGASIISDRWILSAAHCAVGAVSALVTVGMLDTSDSDGTITYNVDKAGIFIHPDYDPTKSPSPDIVLYKLPSSIPFDKYSYIKPVKLSDQNNVESYDGSLATAVGWGRTSSGEGSAILQYATIKVMKNAECIQRFPPGATNATICTDRLYRDASPCSGDSGGPLISNSTSSGDGEVKLVGIISLAVGAPPCSDPNGVAIYTYVPSYNNWISSTMKNN